MEAKEKESGGKKKQAATHLMILAAVVVVLALAYLLATSNFDFADYLVRLHGG